MKLFNTPFSPVCLWKQTFVFITKQNPLIQANTTQVYFNSVSYPHMYGACFSLYLDHPHASNTKRILRKIE